jgi:hypothetical protein
MGDQIVNSRKTKIPPLGIRSRQLQTRNLADRQRNPMVKEGALAPRLPEKPTHPERAFRTISVPPLAVRASLDQEEIP